VLFSTACDSHGNDVSFLNEFEVVDQVVVRKLVRDCVNYFLVGSEGAGGGWFPKGWFLKELCLEKVVVNDKFPLRFVEGPEVTV
jgi:hypothetical protein